MIKKITIILFLPLLLIAQDRGIIEGTVTNSETNEPLPGANVIVKGTYYGAATDLEGHFLISGVSPGNYDIEASMMGYKVMLQTGIQVKPNTTVKIQFLMEQTVLTFGEEVVVIGKKPLFDVDETASISRVSKDDIQQKIVSSIEDILSEQIGVTKVDNEIHIRGGRIDETLYIIDGLSIKDPLSGYSGNLFINPDAIEDLEIITGGYNAEHGQSMSGVLNVKLKEGRDKFEGSFKLTSDNWGMSNDNFSHFSTDRIEYNLGGPSLMLELFPKILRINLPGKFSFFSNGYGKISNTQLPTASKLYPHRNWSPPFGMSEDVANEIMEKLSPREENNWHLLHKLTWEITSQKKLSASYDISLNISQGYFLPRAFSYTYFPYRYINILDYYNTITRESRLLKLNWTHTLNPKTFYEATLGHFITLEHSAAQDLHWTEYKEHLDIDPINYTIEDRDGNIGITYGDEFYDTGFTSEWYDISSDNYRFDLDWTYQTLKRHKTKAGIEGTFTEIQVVDIDEPWTGTTGLGKNYDIYRAKTAFGAFYIQDRIIFEGMTANIGIRYDFWFPGTYYDADTTFTTSSDTILPSWLTIEEALERSIIYGQDALEKFRDETFQLFDHRVKGRLSPRVGISHPVTDNDVLYFYYGHFSQLPTFQYVYAKLQSVSQSTYQLFGNPNLNPKTTVQYELGIKHRFSEDQVMEIKAYWKDMFDYETSQTITLPPPYSNLHFNMYFNADYARARGIEIILKSRFWQHWYADVNFNYSIITGKSSDPNDNLLVQAGELREKPLGEVFMRWDKPFQFFANLSYNHPSGLTVSSRFEYETGRRYTRGIPDTEEYPPDGIREVSGIRYYDGTIEDDKPYYYISERPVTNSDLKISKMFKIGKLKYRIFLEVENVFDERIPRRINPFTGRGYDPGEIIPYSMINSPNPNYNPNRVRRPRTTELGVQIIF